MLEYEYCGRHAGLTPCKDRPDYDRSILPCTSCQMFDRVKDYSKLRIDSGERVLNESQSKQMEFTPFVPSPPKPPSDMVVPSDSISFNEYRIAMVVFGLMIAWGVFGLIVWLWR